jgi:membrane associated rhomboid family serine protease
MDSSTEMVTCYRHPTREAPLRCTRCDRPICLEDSIDAPVGFLCPDDAKQSPRVRRAQAAFDGSRPITMGLLGVIAIVFILQQLPGADGTVERALWLYGPDVAGGSWWRIVTSGFIHFGIIHVAFNSYMLWQLGGQLEGVLGRAAFAGVYLAGLLGGAAGAIALEFGSPAGGASGAVFGLIGAGLLLMRQRGVAPMRSSLGQLLLFNIVFTFVVPNISIGGHAGGLIGGGLAFLALGAARDHQRNAWRAVLVAVGLGVAAVILSRVMGSF